jgi:hypothetical protein
MGFNSVLTLILLTWRIFVLVQIGRKELSSKEFSSQVVIHCNCEVLLHAAKLEHGTDYLTSPPKEGMLRIFIYRKIQRLRPGLSPRTREPEASMRTTRQPKPLPLPVSSLYFHRQSLNTIRIVRRELTTEETGCGWTIRVKFASVAR